MLGLVLIIIKPETLVGGRLEGDYIIKQKGIALKRDSLHFFVDQTGGAIMAEVRAVPTEEDTLIEIVVKEKGGTRRWRASESVRIRIVNLELEGS